MNILEALKKIREDAIKTKELIQFQGFATLYREPDIAALEAAISSMEKSETHDMATDYPTLSDFDRIGLIMVRGPTGWWECHGDSLLQAKSPNTWVKVARLYPRWTHTPDWLPLPPKEGE